MTIRACWPAIRCSSARLPPCKPRSLCARRSGAKPIQRWPVCGIPDVLYVDHGSDFTSQHLEQVAADLRFQLVYSAVARPQGRGKVERLFSTLNTELLPELPGHFVKGKPATPPRLSLSQLDRELGGFLVGTYNTRVHAEIRAMPRAAWLAEGWLPRMPSSLAALDLLLIRVAEERKIHRDGIHFQGMRYMDTTLAGFVGEAVTIRYDPRDMVEVRVFHRNSFLCRAVSPEHSGQSITLKDIQAARISRRRALRGEINARAVSIGDFLLTPQKPTAAPTPRTKVRAGKRKPALRTYFEGSR